MIDFEADKAEGGRMILLANLATIVERSDLEQASALATALRKDGEMAKNLLRISAQRLLPIYQARLELAESISAYWEADLAHFVEVLRRTRDDVEIFLFRDENSSWIGLLRSSEAIAILRLPVNESPPPERA